MRLLFTEGEQPPLSLAPGTTGSGSEDQADVALDRGGTQPQHCEMRIGPQGVVVLHVPEQAQVAVNERPVSGAISLRSGDSIEIGGAQLRLGQAEAASAVNGNGGGAADAGEVAFDDMSTTSTRPALPRYALQGMSGEVRGSAFPVVGTTLIGRGQDCQLPFNLGGLSRQHARLTPMDKGIWIEDLGSTNGCYINGRKVRSGLAVAGAEVSFDELRFRVLAPASDDVPDEPVAVDPLERSVPLKWVLAGGGAALVLILALLLF